MGQARRRKLAGTMSEQTKKKDPHTRLKQPLRDPLGKWQGYSLLGSLLRLFGRR